MLSLKRNYLILVVIFFSFTFIPVYSVNEYTEEERVALDKFRPLVLDALTHEYQENDSYLIRFLRAKELNLVAAANMLHKAQKWRKENKVDGILAERSMFEENGFIESLDGIDREGSPVLGFNAGKMDTRRLILEGRQKDLIRSHVHLWEKMELKTREASNRTGSDISDVFAISDMAGYSRKQHLCAACIPVIMEWVEVAEKYYPGLLKLHVFVNVPRIYDFIIERTKTIQSPHTRRATKIFGHNKPEWSAFLDKYVAPEQRSYQFGGTKKDYKL